MTTTIVTTAMPHPDSWAKHEVARALQAATRHKWNATYVYSEDTRGGIEAKEKAKYWIGEAARLIGAELFWQAEAKSGYSIDLPSSWYKF